MLCASSLKCLELIRRKHATVRQSYGKSSQKQQRDLPDGELALLVLQDAHDRKGVLRRKTDTVSGYEAE